MEICTKNILRGELSIGNNIINKDSSFEALHDVLGSGTKIKCTKMFSTLTNYLNEGKYNVALSSIFFNLNNSVKYVLSIGDFFDYNEAYVYLVNWLKDRNICSTKILQDDTVVCTIDNGYIELSISGDTKYEFSITVIINYYELENLPKTYYSPRII